MTTLLAEEETNEQVIDSALHQLGDSPWQAVVEDWGGPLIRHNTEQVEICAWRINEGNYTMLIGIRIAESAWEMAAMRVYAPEGASVSIAEVSPKHLFNGDEIFVEYKLINKNKFLVFNSEVEVVDIDDKYIDLVFDGVRVKSRISEDAEFILVHIPSGDVSFEVKPRFSMPGLEVQAGGLVAPMPGKVVDLKVKKGSKVKSGETLVILEAMKMEHSIKASEDGVISDIFIKENDQVENGAVLMVVDS